MQQPIKILTYASIGILALLFAGLLSMITPKKQHTVTIGRVQFQVDVADEPGEWHQGLVGHAPLTPGQGMIFIFPTSASKTFWMKEMAFPIDIIWIDHGKVVGSVDQAQPDQGETLYKSPGNVDRVLEIGSAQRKALEITIGAPVTIE